MTPSPAPDAVAPTHDQMALLGCHEMLKLKFAEILSHAIDVRAPYAKVMLDMLATEAIGILGCYRPSAKK